MLENVLDYSRATETAAIGASRWIGTGNKEKAGEAATTAMKDRLDQIHFSGMVKIGEGKKDKSSGLFHGDRVGKIKKGEVELELAIDPIDGTRPTVTSGHQKV